MKQSQKPLLTFCIPAYNASAYLPRCADSILDDLISCEDLGRPEDLAEILIIENGSSDNTTQIAEDLKAEYPLLIDVLHSDKGLPNARNAGMRVARGLYTIFVDADDLWLCGSVRLIRRLINRYHADLYTFGYETDAFVQDHGLAGKTVYANTPEKVEKRRAFIISRPMMRTQAWAKVYRTALIQEKGLYFDERMNFCEDGEYTIRFTGNIDSLVMSGVPVYHYSYSADSMMRGYDEARIDAYIRAMKTSSAQMDGESELIRKAFREYVLCHLNLLLVRNVYNRQINITEEERTQKMKELCEVPVFAKALSEVQMKDCLNTQMLPELFLKMKMRRPAALLCRAKAELNKRREGGA